MPIRFGFGCAIVLGFLFGPVLRAADEKISADPYAADPYWYKPGHSVAPAAVDAIKVAPGFVVERVLTVPREMGSWTALCVDPQGRLIAAAQQVPGLFRVTLPPVNHPVAQASVEKLGGVAAGIGWSHGLLYAFDSLYVTVSEDNEQLDRGVYRLEDTDGDGEFDRSRLLFELDGGGEHGPHSLVTTPDGKSLLLMCGNGTRVPADLDQRRPAATSGIDHLMPPGFGSSKYSTQGWVMRFEPDGSKRELILSGLRNSFDLAFDSAGELFTFDSDAEWDLGTAWYRPTRISHLVTGGEYGFRDDAAVWPEFFEDSVAPVLNVGPASPSGLVFGHGAKFPARYQRALFVCDWTFATVHAVFLEPDGATYTGTLEEFVGGSGLPLTDVVIGQDGAMYLVVGGRRLGSAIYRVRYVGDESIEAVRGPVAPSAVVARRRALEALNGEKNTGVAAAVWSDLGSNDRAIRFAARVALEKQPVDMWRDKALQEPNLDISLMALLALARQGMPEEQIQVVRRCASLPWQEFSAEQKLRGCRIFELALARGGDRLKEQRDAFDPVLTAAFPDVDSRVTRELSRLRCALGDASIIDQVLRRMAADTGEAQPMGAAYFERNPKYGKAVREMFEAAPLVERMHHAQMLLWLTDQWTPEQSRTYFQLLADAVVYSKGGHRYAEFWNQIREAALARVPEADRAALASIGAASAPTPSDAAVPTPKGPGRDWSVETAMEVVAGGLSGRDIANGKAMYSATGCVTCHRLGDEGGTIGPDLTAVGQRFNLRDILEAVIDPSRTISDQYRMMLLKTSDGQTHSGRILSRDDDSTRIAPNLMRPSQTIAVANKLITSEQALPVSIMPSGLVNALNEEELLDFIAYLVSGADPQHAVFKARP